MEKGLAMTTIRTHSQLVAPLTQLEAKLRDDAAKYGTQRMWWLAAESEDKANGVRLAIEILLQKLNEIDNALRTN